MPQDTLFERDGGGRVGAGQEDADLIKDLAGAKVTQHLFAPIQRELHDLDPAGMYSVEAGVGVTFQKDDGAGGILVPGGKIGQTVQRGRIKPSKVGCQLQLSAERGAIRMAHGACAGVGIKK